MPGKEYVYMSATLDCPFGSTSSKLVVLPANRLLSGGKFKANILDAIPFVNILPFGTCKSMANPTVAAATAAAQGVLQQMPCTPVCVAWMTGAPTVIVGIAPALTTTDKLICTFGQGVISIKDSGQGAGTPSIPFPPLFALIGALAYIDGLVRIINALKNIESWEQFLAIAISMGSAIAELAIGSLVNNLLGKVPPPLSNLLQTAQSLVSAYQAFQTGAKTYADAKEIVDTQRELGGEYSARGYSQDEAAGAIAGNAPQCDPLVLSTLGGFPELEADI